VLPLSQLSFVRYAVSFALGFLSFALGALRFPLGYAVSFALRFALVTLPRQCG
jgi:hypothetical protein